MSCTRAFDMDIAAFVRDARAAEWAAFREHYPRCGDCAAEVLVWTELDQMLATAGSHPTPERLSHFAAAGLDASAHREVSAHLAGCPRCRDELTALRRFDFGTLSPDPAATVAAAPSPRRRSWVARLLWHPGFAYAVALALVVYPLLRAQVVGHPTLTKDAAPPAPVAAPQPGAVGQDRDQADARTNAWREEQPAVAAGTGAAPPPPERLMAKREAPESLADRTDERRRAAEEVEARAEGARGSGAIAPGAADRAASPLGAAKSAAAPAILRLDAGAHPTIAFAVATRGLRLRMTETSADGAGVVVRDADRHRDLEARVAAAEDGTLEIVLPAGWLLPGTYRVERPGAYALAFRVVP